MVRGERKNNIRECGVIRGWRGNHTQQRQHAVIGMKICMSWALGYLKGDRNLRTGNGSKINFDIIALRNGQKEMKEWAEQQGNIEIEKNKEHDSEHIWTITRDVLQKMIIEKFPPTEKGKKYKNEDWAKYDEKERMDRASKQIKDKQHEIETKKRK